MVADKASRTTRTKRRDHRADTAYHEAGHIVAIWLDGGEVASCRIGEDPRTGRTQRAFVARDPDVPGGWRPLPLDLGARDDHGLALDLMADAVDDRRGARYGAHILEVAEASDEGTVPRVFPLARGLVEQHWALIESVAQRLLAAGGEMYQDDLAAMRLELMAGAR